MRTRIPRRYLVFAVLALGAGILIAGALPQSAGAARRPSVEVLGFSLRANAAPRALTEPGGVLVANSCKPRRLVAYVSVKGLRRGATVGHRFSFASRLVLGAESPWQFGVRKRVVRYVLQNPQSLPRGMYQIRVKVPGTPSVAARVRLTC